MSAHDGTSEDWIIDQFIEKPFFEIVRDWRVRSTGDRDGTSGNEPLLSLGEVPDLGTMDTTTEPLDGMQKVHIHVETTQGPTQSVEPIGYDGWPWHVTESTSNLLRIGNHVG